MASLMPIAKQQYFDSNGVPLSGGKVYTYAAGTTTPLATYTDSSGSTPNANPVVLDSRGEASIFFTTSAYKIVLKDSAGLSIWTQDNLLPESTTSDLVTYTPAGTGTVATTVQAKLRESVSVLDFGADPTGVSDSTTAIQAAINASDQIYIPAGTYLISTLSMAAGMVLRGESRETTTLKASGASSVLTVNTWKHNITVSDLTIDGNNTAANCIYITQAFRGCYERLNLTKATTSTLYIERDVYFSSFRDILGTYSPIIVNINPTYNSGVEHAVVNDNVFEQIGCNYFSTRAIYMQAAAGNTFTNINYEIADASAVECLKIDHCSNNKFISNWFEPGNNVTSMTRIVYMNDSLAAYYTRNNEFDNCYFIGGTTVPTTYGLLTGVCLRNSVKNSTFLRPTTALQNGSGAYSTSLIGCTFADVTNEIAGSNIDPQVVYEKYGTFQFSFGIDQIDLTLATSGTNLTFDKVYITVQQTKWSGASPTTQGPVYIYDYGTYFRIWHFGVALTAGQTLDYQYKLTYVINA